jgi:hypothetical protein
VVFTAASLLTERVTDIGLQRTNLADCRSSRWEGGISGMSRMLTNLKGE